MNNTIIQWTANGLNAAKKDQLKLMINDYNPYLIIIQETKFSQKSVTDITGYKSYYKNSKCEDRAKAEFIQM
jgi:exonuclease III